MSSPQDARSATPNGAEVDQARLEEEFHHAVQRAEDAKRRMAEANEELSRVVHQSQVQLAEMVRVHELEVARLREQTRFEIEATMSAASDRVAELTHRADEIRASGVGHPSSSVELPMPRQFPLPGQLPTIGDAS